MSRRPQTQLTARPVGDLSGPPVDLQGIIRHGYIPPNTTVPGVVPIQPQGAAFLLDMDLFVDAPQPFDLESLTDQLNVLHGQIDGFFRWALAPGGEAYFGIEEQAWRVADFYERTLYEGEPVRQLAAPTRLDRSVVAPYIRAGQDLLWMLGDWLVRVPAPVIHPAPDVQRMTQELRSWTKWSARQLADVLSTSHTTVLALENGRPLAAGHSGDLRRTIVESHAVVSRIFIVAGRDATRTAQVLDAAPSSGLSARALLARGDHAKAYSAALDVLRPPAEGLLVGSRPAEAGTATAPLHE